MKNVSAEGLEQLLRKSGACLDGLRWQRGKDLETCLNTVEKLSWIGFALRMASGAGLINSMELNESIRQLHVCSGMLEWYRAFQWAQQERTNHAIVMERRDMDLKPTGLTVEQMKAHYGTQEQIRMFEVLLCRYLASTVRVEWRND